MTAPLAFPCGCLLISLLPCRAQVLVGQPAYVQPCPVMASCLPPARAPEHGDHSPSIHTALAKGANDPVY